ncbi:hypothetical protein [Olivibacter sp. LS-1]|uniref:hypothetical protein n=1 Tax=Olivibacter sp. LS-1 TaxID=2592345 RepID=UPI00143CFBC6|nr:hypothetical protein [Olivibacter sp. LS-1]
MSSIMCAFNKVIGTTAISANNNADGDVSFFILTKKPMSEVQAATPSPQTWVTNFF